MALEFSKPKSGVSIIIGRIPERRSQAICVYRGSVIHTVAYFRRDSEVRIFAEALAELLGLELPAEDGEENGGQH